MTTTPNSLMQPIHHRAPVILAPAEFTPWLDPDNHDGHAFKDLLRPWVSDDFEAFPVSALVNNARRDLPGCREPHTPEQVALFESG